MSPSPETKPASPRNSPSPGLAPAQPPPPPEAQHMPPEPIPRLHYTPEGIYASPAVGAPVPQGIPTEGPATHPDGPPREYGRYPPPGPAGPPMPPQQLHFPPHLPPPPHMQPSTSSTPSQMSSAPPTPAQANRRSPKSSSDLYLAPNAAELYNHAQGMGLTNSPPTIEGAMSGPGANHYPSPNGVTRLPPILQVEKQQVTTSATQMASASRRRNEAHFQCPVPGCGSTFTRRFNLRGHLRSHTEERPYVCEWPGCKKGFARQHDCKRHQALHTAKSQSNVCLGCKKTFSRLDALNRHLRSEGGAECRPHNPKFAQMAVDDERLRQAQAQAAAVAVAAAQSQAASNGPPGPMMLPQPQHQVSMPPPPAMVASGSSEPVAPVAH